jgi:ABC-type sugar transport system ATPase subunit
LQGHDENAVTAALSLENINCTFASRDDRTQPYTAVSGATLTVAGGEFVSVVGPTGCGKSTLLNVAAGLLKPSAGLVRVFGEPLDGINAHAGYMFQADALLPWRSALDNVIAGLQFRGVARDVAGASPSASTRVVGGPRGHDGGATFASAIRNREMSEQARTFTAGIYGATGNAQTIAVRRGVDGQVGAVEPAAETISPR